MVSGRSYTTVRLSKNILTEKCSNVLHRHFIIDKNEYTSRRGVDLRVCVYVEKRTRTSDD